MSAQRTAAWLLLISATCCDVTQETTVEVPPDALAVWQDACAEYARVWCDAMRTCLPARFANAYADAAHCEAREALLCISTRFGEGSSHDPAKVHACAAASDLSRQTGDVGARCERWLGWEWGRTPPPDCGGTGELEDGAPCLDGNQCERGSCRGGAVRTATCGVCGEMRAPGDACSADAACEPPSVCVQASGMGGEGGGDTGAVCTKVGGPASVCGPGAPCRPFLRCVDGRCAPLGGLNDVCDPSGTTCAPWLSLACGPDGTCQPVALDRALGESCSAVEVCAAGSACKVGATATTCVEAIADEKVCAVGGAYLSGPCAAPAVCFGGAVATSARCRIPEAASCNPVLPP